MASSHSQSNVASSSFSSSNALDTLDMDQYINFDPSNLLPTPAYSPESSTSKSISTPIQPINYPDNLLLTQPSQQAFAGPSHQYELHKQQTGLPAGALANTLAINEADHIVYGQAQRMFGVPPVDTYYGEFFDFNTAPSQIMDADMDLDFMSPLPESTSEYIDPSAVGGQESSVSSAPAKQRAWPGMHQQQAALAKAQAEEQQQRQRAAVQQRQTVSATRQYAQTSNNPPASKDPIVEERISRLLNQMRHNSVASSNGDASTPTAQSTSNHLGRARKDEEDMDEDERLLASEEGKKLSSKERRQLRNKVSARAFRSRRKEYIGQLEGELATKTAEADDLRAKNQDLMAENTRLTDLTRMLLESPAFSTFLNDLSGTNSQHSTASTQYLQSTPVPKTEESKPDPPKDLSSHQPARQSHIGHDAHVGMVLMPDQYANYGTGSTAWADSADLTLYDAQVYAVTSMPEGPADDHFEPSFLGGKSSSALGLFHSHDAKVEAPTIEYPSLPSEDAKDRPMIIAETDDQEVKATDSEDSTSDPAFALYHSTPVSLGARTVPTKYSSDQLEKPVEHIKLTITNEETKDGEVSTAALRKFANFCANMEGPSQRVAAITSHLQ
ncbi:MAG: hypothetical protein LQ350_007698 [Teloschistes chrysophthalmus]|nr:MAG: hypothetical protein LQ350_007698 [Niorma chrysophthalma]